MTKIDCLRGEHVSGTDRFPIFIGFMQAKELGKVAEAPQFRLATPHEVIAGNISSTPVREWQRPIDPDRTMEIARIFKASSEIMPNAVLLAAPDPSRITLSGQGGDLWALEVKASSKGAPLWILDGQHRITGLSASRPDDLIPFVLLASHGTAANYQESTFAKIFAQVTTTAEGLHPLHHEWLTYAFRLGQYDPTSPGSAIRNSQHIEAMQFAVCLCHERHLDAAKTIANPFFDRVAFNPMSVKRNAASPATGPSSGGFQLDAAEWQTLAFKSYYAGTLPAGKLAPNDLAIEIGRAYEALIACHKASHRADSVLLNQTGSAGSKGHKALQEGLLHGFFRYLAENGSPKDWGPVLAARAIDSTDWRAISWASASRSGTQQTINRKLARTIFESLFSKSLTALFLPGSTVPTRLDLRTYFSGSVGWGLEVQGRRTNSLGRLAKFSGSTDPSVALESGMVLAALDIDSLRTISLSRATTPNLVDVRVADVGRPFEKNWTFQGVRKGLFLEPALHLHSNPMKIRFDFTFYGGQARYVELEVGWS